MIIVPPQIPEFKIKKLENWLKVKAIPTNIGESVLIGALACANSNGIVLPHFTREEEIKNIRSMLDINITIMDTKYTAYGNLVLSNDYGAIVDSKLKNGEIKKIADTLGVETIPFEINEHSCVGSLGTVTNKGMLVHPLLNEKKKLREIFKVPMDTGTINRGIPYVATGLIGNIYGAVVGSMTTGMELFMVGHVLDVV
jgi:translation initiation factor 6